MEINEKVVRDLRKKFDVELNKREVEIVDHWRKEIEAIYKKKYDSFAALQNDLKNLMERMSNRSAVLARLVREAM